ncbi:hypothetical protein ACWE42_07510 [Sutcliffiella cohnii]
MKTIPFNTFMLGGSIAPDPSFFHMLDGGLMFFGGLAVVTIGLTMAEKFDIKIDSSKVALFLQVLFWLGVLWLCLKNPLWSFLR